MPSSTVSARATARPAPPTASRSCSEATASSERPPREHPRRWWLGPEWRLLELLAALPDAAGVEAVWRALG
jgi:hypothetical protein